MKMNSINRPGPMTLQLLRTPDGVRAVFDYRQGASDSDSSPGDRSLSEGVVAESPDETSGANQQFVTLRKLASHLYNIIELEGARLGWTAAQIRAFQAPVERIRDAAQRALDKRSG